MKGPITRSSRIIFDGFFKLRTDLLERHDGKTAQYTSVLLPGNAAVVIAEDTQGRLILNREYRHPTGEFILGCPGGSLQPGEDPLIGGQRELLEETGYASDDISIIGCCYPFPSLCNQKIFYLYAKNASPQAERRTDPFEFIETELKTEAELHVEIAKGAIIDGVLCSALLYKSLWQKSEANNDSTRLN